jgi:Zn-dependent protease/predicted transcriptional regulator
MAVGTSNPQPARPATAPQTPRRSGGVFDESFSLGRIAGVHVGLNWSMLIVFWLVMWSLAQSLFPNVAPGATSAAYWGAAVLGAVLFYLSLLVHEVAHSVVARRYGLTVEGITLWFFGGVSRLQGEATTAEAELRIAAVGPAISLALAVVFAVIAVALAASKAPTLIAAVPAWLSVVNGMLALFNIIPAFPLDGGRVFRALLWRHRGDRTSATRSAARAGAWFGWTLSLLGIVELFGTGSIGGLWLVFLGWFLVAAARAEGSQSVLRDSLRGVRVADVMSSDPIVVPDWIVLQEFIDNYAMRYRHTTFPTRDLEGRINGLVSLAQVKLASGDRKAMRVRDVMWKLDQVPIARPDEPLVDLLERMNRSAATRALVFDGDRLVGIISPADVARILQIAALRNPHAA